MRSLALICAASAFFAGTPTSAREWGTAGGWEVFESNDGDSCGIGQEFEGKGETMLILVEYLDGKVGVMLNNSGWSAEKDKDYELSFHVNGYVYSGGNAIGTGERYETRKGFVYFLKPEFVRDFAAGSGLRVYLGDTLVDNLSLSGTGAAVARMRQCLAHLRSIKVAAERERKRWAHIPDDPFAGKGTPPPPKDQSQPVKLRFGQIASYDYPGEAQRKGMQGRVGFTLTVEPDGRVSKCTITESSGHAPLDEGTCKVAASKLSLTPAKNAGGEAIQGSYATAVTWKLAEPDPPPPPLVIERAGEEKPD